MEHRLAPTTTTCSSLPTGTITGTLAMGAQVALATSITIYICFVQGGADDLEYRVEVVQGRVVCGGH